MWSTLCVCVSMRLKTYKRNNGNFGRKHEQIFRSLGESNPEVKNVLKTIERESSERIIMMSGHPAETHTDATRMNRFNELLGYDWHHIANIHSCTHPIFINVMAWVPCSLLASAFISSAFSCSLFRPFGWYAVSWHTPCTKGGLANDTELFIFCDLTTATTFNSLGV